MLLHYFLQAWRSTRKTLLIFHGTRQVSPDFYLFHNFWKEKKSQGSPPRQSNFLVFGIYTYTLYTVCYSHNTVCITVLYNMRVSSNICSFQVQVTAVCLWFYHHAITVSHWPIGSTYFPRMARFTFLTSPLFFYLFNSISNYYLLLFLHFYDTSIFLSAANCTPLRSSNRIPLSWRITAVVWASAS